MHQHTIQFVRYQLPALLWAMAIFVSSSLSGIKIPFQFISADKLIHFGIFYVLGLLSARAFLFQDKFPMFKAHALLFSILFVMLYGATDEIHQMFVPRRSPEVYDFLADTLGGILATFTIKFLPKKYLC